MKPYNLQYNLKQLRYKNGWNQEDVASQLDISIPAYSKIETGITDINLSRLEQLAKLYNVTIVELLIGNVADDLKELERLKDLLMKRDQEVIELQKQLIEVYKKLYI